MLSMDNLFEFKFQSFLMPIIFLILGSILGSFLNSVIYRLPRFILCQSKNPLPYHSICPHCKARIRARDNIPIISYYLLNKRCRTCRAPIDLQYPIVEILTSILFVLAYLKFGLTAQLLWGLVLITVLIAIAFIDAKTQIIPDILNIPLLGLGIVANYSTMLFTDNPFLGFLLAYVVLQSICYLFEKITHKEGMGYGDVKLLATLGAWFGVSHIFFILFLSSLLATISAGIQMKYKTIGRNTPIPFAPFLVIASLWVLFTQA